MIGICPKCGNYDYDKTVSGCTIECPKCHFTWKFRKLPLFILTGCSGMGKTTTGQELLQRELDFVVLDSDMFYGLFEKAEDKIEHMQSLSRNIMQSGHPVLWTMAGALEKVPHTYNSRFFSEIYCLALVCEEEELRQKMRIGRGITDENWLSSSVEYNRYFQTHTNIGDLTFDVFDMTGKSVVEVADHVEEWVKQKLEQETKGTAA